MQKTLVMRVSMLACAAAMLGVFFSFFEVSPRIGIPGELQTRIRIPGSAAITITEAFSPETTLKGNLSIPLEQAFSIPLDFELTFPVDSTLHIAQDFDVRADVPLDFVYAPQKADMGDVWVDIDTEVFIDDDIDVELLLPITGPVQAYGFLNVPIEGRIPVKTVVPIRQPIRIKDRVKVSLAELKLRVNTVVPISVRVPVRQEVHVKGEVTGRVQKTIEVPIAEQLELPLDTRVPVRLQFETPIKISAAEDVPISIRFDDALPVEIQSLGVQTRRNFPERIVRDLRAPP